MPDYNNGKIYKIVCNITGDKYIGSTVMQLCRRLSTHVDGAKRLITGGCKSKEIILRGDYQIVLIENYPCNNKEELHRKEREHIENNECVKICIPQQTTLEWRNKNRDKLAKIDRKYYEKNSEIVKEKAKNHMEKIKETNPEKIKEWCHQAYLNRKAKLKAKEENK